MIYLSDKISSFPFVHNALLRFSKLCSSTKGSQNFSTSSESFSWCNCEFYLKSFTLFSSLIIVAIKMFHKINEIIFVP